MKRSPLKRKTPLKAKTPLKSKGAALKRSPLAPVSAKGRVSRQRDKEQVQTEGAAFKAAVRGMRCVMCGRTEQEVWDQDGQPCQAHHAVPQTRLRKLGRTDILWHPSLAVQLCTRDHAAHTARTRPVPFSRLPASVVGFCVAEGLTDALKREHPEITPA